MKRSAARPRALAPFCLATLAAVALAQPAATPCTRSLRCGTGGAGFGDQLEHYTYCVYAAQLLNATLELAPDALARGPGRHCCAEEYADAAALLGLTTPAVATGGSVLLGTAPPQQPGGATSVSWAQARALAASWANGSAVPPCGVAYESSLQSCPEAPGRYNWCPLTPGYDAMATARPRLQALAAGAAQRCAARGLSVRTGADNAATPVIVLHVRTGDVCLRCEDGGAYFATLLARLLAASPTLANRHRLVVHSQKPLDFLGDAARIAFANATIAINATLPATVCAFLTADVLIATGSSLPYAVAAFAPRWAPLVVEERRKDATPRYGPRNVSSFPPFAAHVFGGEEAVLLNDGVPELDDVALGARLEAALEQQRRARGVNGTAPPWPPRPPPQPPPRPPPRPPPAPLLASVTLTVVPPNTTHAHVNGTHVVVGWKRKNVTALAGRQVNPLRPNITALWDDRPGCEQLSFYEYSGSTPDSVHVSVCQGPAPASQERPPLTPPRNLDYAICVPPLHGPLNAAWLGEWLTWHAAFRVQAFFIYIVDVGLGPGDVPRHLAAPAGTTLHWLNVSWLASYDTWSVGQHWAIQDCLYRNRAAGTAWALFMDIDELLLFPPLHDGIAGLVRYIESQNVSAASIGSVPYLPEVCTPCAASEPSCGSFTQRSVYRARQAEGCVDRPGGAKWRPDAWRFCPTWHGRRKVITRLNHSTRLEIHAVWEGDHGNDAGVVLDAQRGWIKHVRSAPFMAPTQLCNCTRQEAARCGHGPPGCVEQADGGLNCVSPVNLMGSIYYEQAPSIAEAAAFSDLAAGIAIADPRRR